MSHQATSWAIEQVTGSPSAKATLWSIANYANQKWCAWPSQELIAKESEQSVDSVRRRLRELEERKLVRRIPLKIAGRKTVDFVILNPSTFFAAPLSEVEPLLPKGCSIDPAYVAASCGSADGATLPQTLPQIEPDVAATVRQQEPSEPENQVSSGTNAHARDPLVSEEAIQTAEAIASIAGYPDPKAWPPGWCGSPMRVQAFLNEGYHPQHLLAGAREVMAGSPNATPWSIEYFAKAFARARGRAEAPVPNPTTSEPSKGTARDRNRLPRPGSREDRQEQTANARRKLREFAYGLDGDGRDRGGEIDRPISGGLSLPKPA